MQGGFQGAGAFRLTATAAVALVAALALALLVSAPQSTAQPTRVPTLQLVGSFTKPQYIDNAPGAASAGLLFIVEDAGTIRVVDRGAIDPEPFLDIQGRVEDTGEQGLLSLAFPPDYATSGLFYVYFSNNAGNNEVQEFQVSPGDPTDAIETSGRRVIKFLHPNGNHNGGQMQFTPDGLLWMATGDGGGAGGGDPSENAQNINTPLGKLLRIDPRQSGTDAYTIPASNPFVGVPGRDEIWSYGFRNPWRFSFDANRIAIGDVGQQLWEEVSYETLASAKGANFGWDNYEGTHLFEGPVLTEHELPIHEYSSDVGSGNCAVTGGYVVRDAGLPDLVGRYLYADFCAGELRSFVPTLGGAVGDTPVGVSVASPTTFGEGAARRIYVASLAGPVYRLVDQ